MPNEFSFDLKFQREELETILSNPDVKFIIAKGTYTYNGEGEWEMHSHTIGTNHCEEEVSKAKAGPCPRPC